MRFKGHPAHMMLVHFPSALLPVHFLLRAAGHWLSDLSYVNAAALILPVATVFGWLAILAGVPEFLRLLKTEDNRQITSATLHAGINLCVIGFYTLILTLDRQWQQVPSLTALVVEGTAIALLIIGNFFGGTIVTRYLKF